MTVKQNQSRIFRAVSWLLVVSLILTSLPGGDLLGAIVQGQKKAQPKTPPPPLAIKVNRTVPKVTPVSSLPVFSANPADDEIMHARVFEEPLVPMGAPTNNEENRALVAALLAYLKNGNSENLSSLEMFVENHPQSAWRVSLLTNMGIVYRRTGYFTRALAAWEQAWRLGKDEAAPAPRAIADRAVAEWAELNARLGRYDVLQPLFQEIEGRNISGSPAEKIHGAKQGLWLMLNRPDEAFRCGPMALDRYLAIKNASYDAEKIKNSQSTLHGMSLTQVLALSKDLGMNMQMAGRSPGADILLPSVVHWKAGHYAALLKQQDEHYLIQDPTFGDEFWVSRTALDEQSSGYFLVPAGNLPAGWRSVTAAEGNTVWGKGNTGSDDLGGISNSDTTANNNARPGMGGTNGAGTAGRGGQGPGYDGIGSYCPAGMATYDIHLMLTNLRINDKPVGYTPPRGPDVYFMASYNHRESFQPSLFSYSNLGPRWTFNWLSYVKDDPTKPLATASVYLEGGGEESYTGFDSSTQSYQPQFYSHAVLARTSSSPIRYERRLRDGAVEVFAQPDGSAAFPRRIFMTEWRDATGNKLTFTYDSSLRLVAVTDAIGQVTTLSYELSYDPLKITQVTDPFGRSATFDYTPDGHLSRITDVIGIQSQFDYASGDFIAALTTPYGRTTFQYGETSVNDTGDRRHYLQATDPMGATERVEFRHGGSNLPSAGAPPAGIVVANAYLNFRNSFYWDKRAWAQYPGDYSRATLYHWLHSVDGNMTGRLVEGYQRPLESRIWYSYPNQPVGYAVGTGSQVNAAARVLDDGSTQLTKFEYNTIGNVTKITDPLGRETDFVYGTNNVPDPNPATGSSVDLLRVLQKNGAIYDVLENITYNAPHQPLTVTDAALQTTTFTYTANGDLQTVVTPPRGTLTPAQRTTTYQYYSDSAAFGPGRLQRITGPVSGATTDFAYDGYGRVRTVTESDGYAVTTDYDNFDRPTQIAYPDGTSEQRTYNRLDLEQTRDRLGRWTHYFYDPLRRPVLTRDALGQTVNYQWCNCGQLEKLIDANGNATSWERDAENRVTKETRADGSFTQYVYENTTSRLKRRTDPRGQNRDVTYFKDDNVQQISYSNAPIATPGVSFTYDPIYNRIITMTDGTGTTSYTYYPVTTSGTLGAAQLKDVVGPLPNSTITYSYDELGRVVSRSINSVSAAQTYDPLSRIASVTNVLGNFTYSYVGTTSRIQNISYPNGQTTSFAYFPNSADRRLQEINNQKTGAITISKFNYTYDPAGNVTTWTQQADTTIRAYDFTYDATDQLTTARLRTADAVPTTLKRYGYVYDRAGNRTTEQIDDAPLTASYDNMNRLLTQQAGNTFYFSGTVSKPATVTIQGKPAQVSPSNTFFGTAAANSGTVAVTAKDYSRNQRTNTYQLSATGTTKSFTYDANGNMTSDGTRTFEWDAENRLTAITNGPQRSEFSYDGLSRRIRIVEKTNGATTSDTRFLWCGEELCEERDSTGATTTKRFFAQGEQQGPDNFFYTRDHLGSIRELVDSAGATRARYDYDPYGRSTKTSGDRDASFGFAGGNSHIQTGFLLLPHRIYDPTTGRFLSEDPTGIVDGPNLYDYVQGNPTNYIDPTGEGAVAAVVTLIGGTLGFVGTGGLALATGGVLSPTIVAGTAGGLALGAATGMALENALESTKQLLQRTPDAPARPLEYSEHDKGARPSTKEKHEEGEARRKKDRQSPREDMVPRTRPPGHKGPWPPPGKKTC